MGYYNTNPFGDEDVPTELESDREYTKGQLNAITDAILKQDARSELCRECGKRGTETGESKTMAQEVEDKQGRKVALVYPEFICENDHKWYEGEGKTRGIQGDSPILFEEHLQQRRKREIHTAEGTPDPNIVSGMYNRTHPQGRKVNSLEQRRKNGASWYR
jgi:hypothetical protein